MVLKDYAKKKKRAASPARKIGNDSSSRARGGSRSKRTERSGQSLAINLNPMFILVVVVGGLFAASIFYLEYLRDFVNKNIVSRAKAPVVKIAENKKISVETKNFPKFEFYHTLPKMDVAVNNYQNKQSSQINSSSMKNTVETKKNLSSTKSKYNYILQLASFRDLKDAEELRARLILAGFDVSIYSVKLDSGDTWHRVRTKRVAELSNAENLSAQLQKHNIKSIILTEKAMA